MLQHLEATEMFYDISILSTVALPYYLGGRALLQDQLAIGRKGEDAERAVQLHCKTAATVVSTLHQV